MNYDDLITKLRPYLMLRLSLDIMANMETSFSEDKTLRITLKLDDLILTLDTIHVSELLGD